MNKLLVCQHYSPTDLSPVVGGTLSHLQFISTSGPSPRVLKESLNMEVDENTPKLYSRLACCHGNEVAMATGFPLKVNILPL